MLNPENIILETRNWLQNVVIDLNLCPFAKRELAKDRIRFCVTNTDSEECLLENLNSELELIFSDESIETTLLIIPDILQDFYDFNQFLELADRLLVQMDFEGIFQIASFHPDYQFDGTDIADVENYTNRSPYPILHILREDSVEKAIASYPDSDKIPDKNIALLKSLGVEKIISLTKEGINE
jgi:hypothetical protein